MRKKVISMMLIAFMIVMTSSPALAAEDDEKNVCLKKPMTISSSNEFDYGWGVYTLCANDGDWSTRAATASQKTYGNYQWYLIDLCANYTISEVVLGVSAGGGGVPKSFAVDVYSGGKWVRVAQQYDLEAADFPMSVYFDEIDCSYIQVSTNEYSGFLGFTEIQAYYTKNISKKEKADSYQQVPSGGVEIPMPSTVSDYLFKQGLRSNVDCNEAITNIAYLMNDTVYTRSVYTDADIAYMKTIYSGEELSEKLEEIVEATPELTETLETVEKLPTKDNSRKSEEQSEKQINRNQIVLIVGISLVGVAVFVVLINVIPGIRVKTKKEAKKE